MLCNASINIKRKKYPIFLAFILVATYLVFVDLVDGDWASLENSLDNLSVFLSSRLSAKKRRACNKPAGPINLSGFHQKE